MYVWCIGDTCSLLATSTFGFSARASGDLTCPRTSAFRQKQSSAAAKSDRFCLAAVDAYSSLNHSSHSFFVAVHLTPAVSLTALLTDSLLLLISLLLPGILHLSVPVSTAPVLASHAPCHTLCLPYSLSAILSFTLSVCHTLSLSVTLPVCLSHCLSVTLSPWLTG